MTRALGVDVSNHQAIINWGALAGATATLNGHPVGQVEFAIIKATEGTHFVDPYFAMNWSGAKVVGMARGAYHFMRADSNGAEVEADYFLATVAPALEPGDVVALDIEDYPGIPQPKDLYHWVATWLARVENTVGFKPLIYSTAGYLAAHGLTGDPVLSDYGLWLASWYGLPPVGFPAPPPDWPFAAVWQFTSSGRVAGISGDCDLNYCNGDIDTFRAYGKPAGGAAPVGPSRAPLDHLYQAILEVRAEYTGERDQEDADLMTHILDRYKWRYNIP